MRTAQKSTSSRWSNADVLRLSHPKTTDPARNGVYRWCVDGIEEVEKRGLPVAPIIAAFERAKKASTSELVSLIQDHNLSREMLPTESLDKREVWEALLDKMPMTAMIRNLGNMSKCGLLAPMSDASRTVCERLRNIDLIKKARVHPIAVLVAMKTYGGGKGMRGSGAWTTVQQVVDALDDAFYLSFGNVEPIGKRILFGLDVSASMGAPAGSNLPITCCEGASAMAMVCARTERDYHIMAFDQGIKDLRISPRMRLDDVLRLTRNVNFGGTDCALPMIWAEQQRVSCDAFVVITDNETWAGRIHPKQALRSYREKMNVPHAKQVIMAMTPTTFSIADPSDLLTMDVVGFDTATPQVVSDFIKG